MTTNRFHAIRLAALLTALALVATACGGSDEGSTSSSSAATDGAATTTSEPLAITLSYDWPTVDFEAVPIVVAQQKGWFAEQGVDVELIFPPDAASSAKVLATGDSDLALLTTTDIAFSVKSELPITSIGNYTMSNNWGLFTKPGTPVSIDGLKGKRISTYGDSWTKAKPSKPSAICGTKPSSQPPGCGTSSAPAGHTRHESRGSREFRGQSG